MEIKSRLCKKIFHGASRQIKFGWRYLFPDFALQKQERGNYLPDVSAASPRRILFGLRAFCARVRAHRMHADQILFLGAMTC